MKKYLVLILLAFIGFTSYSQTSNDADAQAFITACDADPAGKLTPDQKNYITQMVEGMKSIGVWSGMKAVYPLVGNTAFKNKFNLKDPRDLDVAFRLVYVGTITHSANGMQGDGFTGYANTFIVPSDVLINNNTHIAFYSNLEIAPSASLEIGSQSTATTNMALYVRFSGDIAVSQQYINGTGAGVAIATNTQSKGMFIASKSSSSSNKLYIRGSLVAQSNTITADNVPNVSLALLALRRISGAVNDVTFFSNKRCAFASIGAGLTDNQAQ
jgi:hypothetical protein